jgi:hypothetical protein
MDGFQFHTFDSTWGGTRGGRRDPEVEEPYSDPCLDEDIEALGLDIALSACNSGIVASGHDDLVKTLAPAQFVVFDHSITSAPQRFIASNVIQNRIFRQPPRQKTHRDAGMKTNADWN